MFNFFESIVGFIVTIVNFVVSLFSMLVFILQSIGSAVSWLFICIGYLPAWLTAFVVVPLSLSILFQVLNKGD